MIKEKINKKYRYPQGRVFFDRRDIIYWLVTATYFEVVIVVWIVPTTIYNLPVSIMVRARTTSFFNAIESLQTNRNAIILLHSSQNRFRCLTLVSHLFRFLAKLERIQIEESFCWEGNMLNLSWRTIKHSTETTFLDYSFKIKQEYMKARNYYY